MIFAPCGMALKLFKNLKSSGLLYLRARTIMSSSFNLKKVEDELKKNPYFGKYQEKIEKLRKERPVEYHARMKGKEKKKRDKKDKEKVKYPEPKGDLKSGNVKRSLSDILKMEMVENKTAEEISDIWLDYHRGKDLIYSIYTSGQYEKLNENYSRYPTFVLPLPRGDGYEFFLFQYSENVLHFTPMSQFKKYGENSPECLSVVYFTELKEKNVILMRGEYDKDVISSLEGQYLLNVTHIFYNGESDMRTHMLEMFNNKPDDFKFPEIISEVERIGFNIARMDFSPERILREI